MEPPVMESPNEVILEPLTEGSRSSNPYFLACAAGVAAGTDRNGFGTVAPLAEAAGFSADEGVTGDGVVPSGPSSASGGSGCGSGVSPMGTTLRSARPATLA